MASIFKRRGNMQRSTMNEQKKKMRRSPFQLWLQPNKKIVINCLTRFLLARWLAGWNGWVTPSTRVREQTEFVPFDLFLLCDFATVSIPAMVLLRHDEVKATQKCQCVFQALGLCVRAVTRHSYAIIHKCFTLAQATSDGGYFKLIFLLSPAFSVLPFVAT